MAGDAVQLVALVNSFNRLALLQAALQSLADALAQCPWPSAIVVFEAGSNDGSAAWLEEFGRSRPGVALRVIAAATGEDTSFAAGCNRAAAVAAREFTESKWWFLFESDNLLRSAEPLPKAVALLQKEPSLGAVGFAVTKLDGTPAGYGCPFPTVAQFVLGPKLTYRLRLDRPRELDEQTRDGTRWWRCDVVFTSPLLVRRASWEQAGGMDATAFPFSDSDLDLAFRWRAQGWTLGVMDTGSVVHDNRAQLSAWSARRTLDWHRGRYRCLRRHQGAIVAWAKPLLWARHGVEWLMLAALVAARRRPAAALAVRWTLWQTAFRGYVVSPRTTA